MYPLPNRRDLEADLDKWLEDFAQHHGLTYRKALPGSSGFKSDGLITDGRKIVAIEIEESQTHPDTNVGKYWLLHEEYGYERAVLIHVFLSERHPSRERLAKFYAEKMRCSGVPFEYVVLDYRNRSISYEGALKEIKGKIQEYYYKVFGSHEASRSNFAL